MRCLNLVILFFFSVHLLHGQEVNPGPRFTAMGNSGVALSGIWSLQSNQAGMTGIQHPEVALGCESSFLQSDILTQTVLAAIPYRRDVFGLSMQKYGVPGYNQNRISLAYSKRLGNEVSAAVDFNFNQLTIDKYGSASAWSVEAGVQYRLSKELTIGSHLSNPTRGSFDNSLNATIPVVFEFGTSWITNDCLTLNGALVLDPDNGGDFRSGLEYKPLPDFSICGGMSCHPFREYAGFCFNYHALGIQTAVAFHPGLGYSPQLSVCYEL